MNKRLLWLILFVGILWAAGFPVCAGQTVNVVQTAKTVQGGKWVTTKSGKMYQYADGSYAKGVWLKISGSIYRFSLRGLCHTGWFSWSGSRYYADSKGRLIVSNLCTINKAKYYFQSDGTLAVSKWIKINGNYYFFSKTGKMLTNVLLKINGKTWYLNSSGVRMCSVWLKKNGKKYYFGTNGVMLKSCWKYLSGRYYYFGSDGAMATSKWINGYYVGADGQRKTNCVINGYYYNGTGKKSQKISSFKYIFVGDSRVVRMSRAVTDTDTMFLGLGGKGYVWLKNTGGVQLMKCLAANPDVSVVLCLGVNDLYNYNSYISYYKKLIASYPDTRFYILSVNPVVDSSAGKMEYPRTNAKIEAFNAKMYKAFPSIYIDTYSWLQKNGFETTDGLHYTADTSKVLYQYILSKIK